MTRVRYMGRGCCQLSMANCQWRGPAPARGRDPGARLPTMDGGPRTLNRSVLDRKPREPVRGGLLLRVDAADEVAHLAADFPDQRLELPLGPLHDQFHPAV